MGKTTLFNSKLLTKQFLLLLTLISFNVTAQKRSISNIQNYDLVILNGRVVDPESKLDAIRNIGVANGTIQTISCKAIKGRSTINATGLVVSPGFIDLHQHGHDLENYAVKAMDGVTTALELETGTADVDHWYTARKGKALINYCVSAGHMPIRMKVMRDSGRSVPTDNAANHIASDTEVKQINQQIEHALRQGAVAVGFIIQFTPAAARSEIIEAFRVAKRYSAPCHVHIRFDDEREPKSNIQALEEVIAAAAVTGASLHVVHIHSMGGSSTPRLLQMISEAKSHGLDITTETYPYTAWMTEIESTTFNEGWQQIYGMDYNDLQWAVTGERLTAESFARYRKQGGLVIGHQFPEELVQETIVNPLTMIASDGELENGKGHPRTAGTYSRVLGHYVRQTKTLTLMDALRRMTLMPAQRLEQRVPKMKNKGRIRVGADADITIFDAEKIIDQATYEEPAKYSEGIIYVLVNGVLVVNKGKLNSTKVPGQAIRAPNKR